MSDPFVSPPRPAGAPGDLASIFQAGRASYFAEDLAGAEAAFRQVLAIAPAALDARIALGMTLLKQGRLKEGFPLLDAWREHPGHSSTAAPDLPFPRWGGEDVAGKRFLIWSEGSLADQIMYARFARVLRERGALVSWLCPPELSRLLGRGLGIHAVAGDRPVELVDFDFYCPSSALPLGFDLDIAALPAEPYLAVPPGGAPAAPAGVAVVTDGLPDDLARRLLAQPGATPFPSADRPKGDLHDLALQLVGFERVITLDSTLAHLAGALGRPVQVLVPFPADWRWLKDRPDSPWYPTAHLLRQTANGSWRDVP